MKLLRCDNLARYSNSGGETFIHAASAQLEALGRAIGRRQELASDLSLQGFLFEPWGRFAVPAQPIYPSLIGDDHSPYEYSLAFGRNTIELRILFEAQARAPEAKSNQEAASAVNQRLAARYGVDLSRFETISDLFLLNDPVPPFSLWHAVVLNTGCAPQFKVYLNPAARGRSAAREVVLEGMARLGLARAGLDLLSSRCLRSDEDELRYISLDLSRGPGARVKIYFAHHDATAAHLERVFSLSPSHRQGDVSEFCAQMVGRRRQFAAKPLTSCFSFVAGQDVPSAVTLHVPVAHYVRDDATVGQRFGAYLERQGVSAQPYSTALAALAKGPLDASSGLQSYASFRREPSGLRATAYLSPMVFSGTSAQSEVRRSFR